VFIGGPDLLSNAVITPIHPGAAIGVLGGGQLGRMFAMAARRMGYRVHTFSPDADTPTGQVSDVEVIAPYHDLDAVRRFAKAVRVVTFEFENVPAPTAEAAAEHAPVRPAGSVLHTTQHRIREKTFLADAGLPLTPFRVVSSPEELTRAVFELGCPSVLKTADFGYDGKGQALISSPDQAPAAWESIGLGPAVLEAFVSFEREISVVAARGADGAFVDYGAIENKHRNRILDISIAPARVEPEIVQRAREIARAVLEALQVVGVLCVEFFVKPGGELLINELAPRPHNSGHLTFDASLTSQFEQQLRAVCGLPLGATDLLRPAAMANLLGDLWNAGEPDWDAACRHPDVKLHLYGKLDPRPGRKMGHLTAIANDSKTAFRDVKAARKALLRPVGGL
jgi:5-(carboxyamino)imidazole ribonucleotide synthase